MAAAADNTEAPKKTGKPIGKLVPIIAAAVGSAVLAGGVAFFLGARSGKAPAAEGTEAAAEHGSADKAEKSDEKGEGKEGKGKPETIYLPLAPAFIVNLGDADSSHLLQIEMEVQVKTDAIAETVKLHSPRLRNSVLMLLSQQKVAEVMTREGKETLQKQVLEELRKILTEQTGKPCIEAVYFTSFVIQ
jgi:flagellar FliL protein